MKKSVCVSAIILNVLAFDCWPQSPIGQGPVTPLTQTAVIAGTVVSETKDARLSGAIVTAYRRSPETPVYRSQSTTDANGAFSLGSLPAGTYNICVQVPGSNYLDPCTWTTSPTSVVVADGKTVGGNTIRLISGGILKVRRE
jgi:hypothetical protein